MNINIFLENFQDILQTDLNIEPQMLLKDIEEWDSLTAMAIIAFYEHKFQKKVTFAELESCQSVADIIALAGDDIVQ